MTRTISPLRYPGGKHRFVEYLRAILEENELVSPHLYEPFAGGASVSLGLLAQGKIARTTILDSDPLVASFWSTVVSDSQYLCDRVRRATLSVKAFKRMSTYLECSGNNGVPQRELGFACLYLNRTSYSGILGAGPIGGMSQSSEYGIGCRFNAKDLVNRIRSIARLKDKISVLHGDGIEFLRENAAKLTAENCVVYIDPPYYVQGRRLYRYHYQKEDHQRLIDFVKCQSFPWVVSYDKHPDIQKWFKAPASTHASISCNYSVRISKNVEEVVYSNLRLPKTT